MARLSQIGFSHLGTYVTPIGIGVLPIEIAIRIAIAIKK